MVIFLMLFPPQSSAVSEIHMQQQEVKNMWTALHRTEVRCAGGDADMKCLVHCWAPAWKVIELACDTEAMQSEWTCDHPGGKRSSPSAEKPCPRLPLLSRERELIWRLSWGGPEPSHLSGGARGAAPAQATNWDGERLGQWSSRGVQHRSGRRFLSRGLGHFGQGWWQYRSTPFVEWIERVESGTARMASFHCKSCDCKKRETELLIKYRQYQKKIKCVGYKLLCYLVFPEVEDWGVEMYLRIPVPYSWNQITFISGRWFLSHSSSPYWIFEMAALRKYLYTITHRLIY